MKYFGVASFLHKQNRLKLLNVWDNTKESCLYCFLIFLFAEQSGNFIFVSNFKEPWFLGVFVDEGGVFLNLLIMARDFSCNRCVHICCNFDALNHDSTVLLNKDLASVGKLDVNYLSQLLLSIVRNANSCNLSLGEVLNPFVAICIFARWLDDKIHEKNLRRNSTDLI
jgi:hypothetical protein